eukprot:168137-Chlamydomonas_euryale.AAC.2
MQGQAQPRASLTRAQGQWRLAPWQPACSQPFMPVQVPFPPLCARACRREGGETSARQPLGQRWAFVKR